MPIYEYQCEDCGASVEAFQKMSDDPLTVCEKCGGPLRKVLHPVAIHFKGSGFYTTDYGKGSGRKAGSRDGGSGDGSGEGSSSSASSGSDSSESKSSGSKSASDPGAKGGKAKEAQKST